MNTLHALFLLIFILWKQNCFYFHCILSASFVGKKKILVGVIRWYVIDEIIFRYQLTFTGRPKHENIEEDKN
jgi:hypothetical protein